MYICIENDLDKSYRSVVKFANKISIVQKDGHHTSQTQPDYDKPYYKLAPSEKPIVKSVDSLKIQEEEEVLYELAARQEPTASSGIKQQTAEPQDFSDSDTDREFANGGNDEDTDYAIDALESALKLLSPKVQRKPAAPTLLSSVRSWNDSANEDENEEDLPSSPEPLLQRQRPLVTQSQPNISTLSSQESIASSTIAKKSAFKPRPPANPRPSKLPTRPNRYCKYSPETIRKLTTAQSEPVVEYADGYYQTADGNIVYQDEYGNFVSVPNLSITKSMSNINQTGGSYVGLYNKKSNPVEKELMNKIKHSLTMKQYADRVRVDNRLSEISKGTTVSKSRVPLEKRRDPNEIRKEIENERLKRRNDYGNRVTVAPRRYSISADPEIVADRLPDHVLKQRSSNSSTPRQARKAIDHQDDFEALEASYLAKKEKVDAIRRQFFQQSLTSSIN